MSKHIEITRKSSHTFSYTLEDEDGNPIDITSDTPTMTFKKERKNSAVVLTKDGTITSGTLGTFTIPLTPTETTIPAGKYFYDVIVTVASNRYLVERGTVIVHPNITT